MAVYKPLTKYLAYIENDSFGEWVVDRKSKGTPEDPIQMPYVEFSDMVKAFEKDVYDFSDKHPEYELNRYSDILRENGIEWGDRFHERSRCFQTGWEVRYGVAFRSCQGRAVL